MTKVKICGLTESETLEAALAAGADFIGLNFYPKSPRYVSLDQAKALADQARGRTKIVTLTVDATDDVLNAITSTVRPDYIQVHGKETPGRVAEIAHLTGLPVIKAIGVASADDVQNAKAYTSAAFILFDAKPHTLPGGNGVAFDWSLMNAVKTEYMLAGGLTPLNVAEAIRITGTAMVDVSSGVETAPGQKDEALIRKFIEAAKSVN
jgi:phosphoribosylanthranilate isomerase